MKIKLPTQVNRVSRRHFIDSMEHAYEKHHAIALWLLYGGVASILLIGLAIAGSRLRTRVTPTGTIKLSTPYSTYLVGEQIQFTITNNFNSAITFANNCPNEPLVVYKQVNNQWQRVHDRADAKTCKNQAKVVKIASRSSASGSFAGHERLFSQPGKYRIAAYVEFFNTVAVRDINVIAKPAVPAIPALLSSRAVTGNSRQSTSSKSQASTSSTAQNITSNVSSSPTTQSKTISLSAGTIQLTYSSTTIYLGSVTPKPPCSSYEANRNSGSSIEVTFKCSGDETQILLYLSGGTVVYNVDP